VDWSIPARPRVITGGDDDLIKVWAAGTGSLLGTMSGHSGEVRSVEVSADGRRIVSAADDKTVVVWDGHDFEELLTLRGHSAPVHKVHISHDGTSLVSAADDQSVKVWKFVARNRPKTDWMGALEGAARGEKLIKSERLLFKERAVVR
jgi:WD40 repeat protein